MDGTSEFTKAAKEKLSIKKKKRFNNLYCLAIVEQVTVLIGISYKGKAVAGIINQPYFNNGQGRTIWGIKEIGTFGIRPIISIFF